MPLPVPALSRPVGLQHHLESLTSKAQPWFIDVEVIPRNWDRGLLARGTFGCCLCRQACWRSCRPLWDIVSGERQRNGPLSLSWDDVFQRNELPSFQVANQKHKPPFLRLLLLVPGLCRKYSMIWVRKMICKASQPPFHPNLFSVTEWGWEVGHMYSIQESVVFSTGSRRDFKGDFLWRLVFLMLIKGAQMLLPKRRIHAHLLVC